jgi:hypothetical protein
MPAKNVLRTLVVLQVAVWIMQRLAASISVPTMVQMFGLRSFYVDPVTSLFGRAAGNALFVALFLGLLVASFGLCSFSAVSRTFYLIVNIVAIVLGVLHGPMVRSGAMDFFYSANIVLAGVILTMVYSSPLKGLYQGLGTGLPPVHRMAEVPAVAMPQVQQESFPLERAAVPLCSACGASTQGAKFCPQCGRSVVTKKACSRCGVELESAEKFCHKCGNPTT